MLKPYVTYGASIASIRISKSGALRYSSSVNASYVTRPSSAEGGKFEQCTFEQQMVSQNQYQRRIHPCSVRLIRNRKSDWRWRKSRPMSLCPPESFADPACVAALAVNRL